jgi:DNA-binding SARP family transcriptional activator
MDDPGSGLAADDRGSRGLEHYLERLTEELGKARCAGHPADQAQHLAQVQRLSGWALRQAVATCHEGHGMAWHDTASAVQLPLAVLSRQYEAGGRIVVGDPPSTASPDGPEAASSGPGKRGTRVDLLILGELAVRVDGRDLPLPGGARVRALLGALALAPGDVVGETRLLELAWGAGKGSRRALQCTVHRLRTWLRDVAGAACRLEFTGSGYRLAMPADAVDIARFRDRVKASATTCDPEHRLALLSAALGEWRGPVLGGRPEWLTADPIVRAVEQARVDTAGALAELASQLGRPAEFVPAVGAVAAAAPYDEPLHARLVRLLSRCGRHAEALLHVEQVRQRLADDLGIAPSGEVRNAHVAALRGDDRSCPVPMQLPPDVPDFTGRQDEFAAISGPILSGGHPYGPCVFVINGPAGIGKSAFAVHTAHRVAPLFDDGQLHANLRGPGCRPADPADVLGGFLRALGVRDQAIPASFEDRAALYRSRTAGRRILVVLDDARDESQVRPLVPGTTGCAVLVTSRRKLPGLAGARVLALGTLARDDAVRLLGAASGREGVAEDPEAPEVTRLCGGLPLAVRVAGVCLATRPRLTPGGLATRLRDEDHRLDVLGLHGLAVRPSLDAGYEDLTPGERRTVRFLSLLATPDVAAWAAAALLGVSPDVATTLLESLVDAEVLNLLGEDVAGQPRYGLPVLTRLHARERARAEDTSPDRVAALRRAFGAWLRGLERSANPVPEDLAPPVRHAAVPSTQPVRHGARPATRHPAWFEAEADAVRAVVDQAWALGAAFDDLTVALTRSALGCYARLGREDDVRHLRRIGRAAARRATS